MVFHLRQKWRILTCGMAPTQNTMQIDIINVLRIILDLGGGLRSKRSGLHQFCLLRISATFGGDPRGFLILALRVDVRALFFCCRAETFSNFVKL